MREILFKAKRTDNGEWVQGDLVQSKPTKDGHFDCWIKTRSILGLGANSTPTELFTVVDPETVCQFAGLNDYKGNKIFNGDILRHPIGDTFIVKWSTGYCGFRGVYGDLNHDLLLSIQVNDRGRAVVVSNIHDSEQP